MGILDYFAHHRLGKRPAGARLERIQKSPNYRNGSFQNKSVTPDLTNGATYFSILKEMLFLKNKLAYPDRLIPSVKTDLLKLDQEENILVWFGHSSYFIQLDGKRILVDPVLSGYASPVSFTTKAFKGTEQYQVSDIPGIDFLIITHDHYDHLDYKTILKLKPKINHIITGLGTAEHFEFWGFESNRTTELDWNEMHRLDLFGTITCVPSRHFSGRGLTRNHALWASFVLQTPTMNVFIGGDSGYDSHFAEIGNEFGPFDLAIMENGQYNKSWQHIHLMPDEFLMAAADLKAKRILPVHSGKFALGNHAWNEPLELLLHNKQASDFNIITPMIGEKVHLDQYDQRFGYWWQKIS